MEDFLLPVLAKLNRARTQVQSLTGAIAAWATAHPVQARCELREGRLGYRLIQADYTEAPPTIEWGLQVGECAHNIRSSLDNLAYALARLREDPPKRPNAIAFPIYREAEKFAQAGRKAIEQLPQDAAKLIERFQPFKRDGSEREGTVQQDPLLYQGDSEKVSIGRCCGKCSCGRYFVNAEWWRREWRNSRRLRAWRGRTKGRRRVVNGSWRGTEASRIVASGNGEHAEQYRFATCSAAIVLRIEGGTGRAAETKIRWTDGFLVA